MNGKFLFEDYGGILDVSNIPDGWEKHELFHFVDLCNLTTGLKDKLELSAIQYPFPDRTSIASGVFVIKNEHANAFACLNENKPLIGIFAGLPILLKSFYLTILADEQLFQGLDDVYYLNPERFNVGDHKKDHFSNNSINNSQIVDNYWDVINSSIPKVTVGKIEQWGKTLKINQNRAFLATILSFQAGLFFVFHELGHIAFGHINYLKKLNYASTFLEFNKIRLLSSNKNLRLAFEYEADRYAIDSMVIGFFANPENLQLQSESFSAMTRMSRKSKLRIWITTMGALFLLLEAINNKQKRYSLLPFLRNASHPPPVYRFSKFIHRSFAKCQEKMKHFLKNDFDEAYNESLNDLEIIAKKLRVDKTFNIRDINSPLYNSNIKKAYSALDRVADELFKYSKDVETNYKFKIT